MKLYLDGMFFRSTGVGRVYENLLSMLLEDPGLEVLHTAVPAALADEFRASWSDARLVPHFLPYGPMTVGDLVRKTALLRQLRGRVDLFHFPGHNVPLGAPRPFTVTINDTTASSPLFRVSPMRRAGFRWLLGRAVAGSRRVLTISQAAAKEIEAVFPRAKGKIEIVSPWVEEKFFAVQRAPTEPPEDGYLLWLGLRIAHKNLEGLLAAFELLAARFPRLRLILAGRRYSEPDMVDLWRTRSPVASRVEEIVDPTDEEIADLFAQASIFVFPSLAEGFGLPPLEAMAAGVPVVCTDLPAFREIHRDAVEYAAGSDGAALARAVQRLLEDPERRRAAADSGIGRAREFAKSVSSRRLRNLLVSLTAES